MTPRDRRLERIELDLRLASLRRGELDTEPDVTISTEELEAIIKDRLEHPQPVRERNQGEEISTDHYAVEELQEILDFELKHPRGGDHR